MPLYYENRTPELGITNPDLNEEIYQVIDEAGLDDDQEEKLKKVLGKRYHLITRGDRLDAVAKDIVHHFLNRGYQGKAMVVSIDKLTTLRMFEKVRAEWEAERARVEHEIGNYAMGSPKRIELEERLANLRKTDMAVVVSPGQNEVQEMKERGFDILPRRVRMAKEDLETKFKDPDDDFRLVFVCAMWLTGFDAPSCSTLYLDKPMRGHTLMQTIARANRVYKDKVNGLIVEEYNSGALSIEQLFEQLVNFSKELSEEEQRHIRENISEEELAVFDILTRPGPELSDKETDVIKKICREMLAKLKTEKLVLDWRKRRTTRAAVRVAIEEMLDAGLPEKYTVDLFEQKCGALFQHLLEKYPQKDAGVYAEEVA